MINNLVVDEHLRGRGLGESLLREAIQHCQRKGIVELHVWTDFDNEPAKGLYRKLGFMDRSLLLELNLRSAMGTGPLTLFPSPQRGEGEKD